MFRKEHTAEEIAPDAGNLVESLRDFGYTLPSALADLIDNSLAAEARKVHVTLEARGEQSHFAVVDDGHGMDETTLVEAMRMGTVGPSAKRNGHDLGRFGLGMKTASLSQGRCLTVISRTASSSAPVVRCWDIDHIAQTGSWQLLRVPTPIARPYLERVGSMKSGTAVVIEKLDRPGFLRVAETNVEEHVGSTLDAVRQHLAMVFHRFIEDGVEIRLGRNPVHPWDPFLSEHSAKLPSESLQVRNGVVQVTPFVLPHYSRLSDEQHAAAAGPDGWNAHQGFYIYRCRRLIVPGTWLNLGLRKEEHYKLARIRVDLPNSTDVEWHLNVMKSHVSAPAYLRDDFRRIAAAVRRQAAEVYRFRGERVAPKKAPAQRFLWRREEVRTGVRYRIDRTHPLVRALLHNGCGHEQLLNQLLGMLEGSLPVASMLQEPAKSLDGSVTGVDSVDAAELVDALVHAEQFFVRAGRPPAEAREAVLSAEPFVHYRKDLLALLDSGG